MALALLPSTALGETDIDLRWAKSSCPSRATVIRSLQALGLSVTTDRGDALTIEARAWTDQEATWELTLEVGGKRWTRPVQVSGSCQERAAVLAAVIERMVLPISAKANNNSATAPASLEPEPRIVESAPEKDHEPASPAQSEAEPGPPPSVAQEPLRLRLMVDLLASVGEQGRVRPGLGLGVQVLLLESLSVTGHLDWRWPLRHDTSAGTVRVDDLRVGAGARWRPGDWPLALSAELFLQGVWARGDRSLLLGNPGAAVGLRYSYQLGPWQLEAGISSLVYMRRQELVVDDRVVLQMPRWEAELRLGMSYGL